MYYALNNERYPIETAEQVKIASDYFQENITKFSPVDRVNIADNMEKRANDLSLNLDLDFVPNYSRMMKIGAGYSPDFEYNMKLRKEACEVGKVKVKLGEKEIKASELFNKMAENKNNISPLKMVASISELDKMANLESHYDIKIMDPVFTVFGSNSNPNYDKIKLAEGLNDIDLKKAANDSAFISKLSGLFGKDFANEFKQSPVEIFQSMPIPERQIIIEKLSAAMVSYKCYSCENTMKIEAGKSKVVCPKCGSAMKKVADKVVEEVV